MSSPHPPDQLVQPNQPQPSPQPPVDAGTTGTTDGDGNGDVAVGDGDDDGGGGDATPPAKKRKIVAKTPQERAEEKAKKEEEKTAREEEKAKKDEEKRKREEERNDERRKREEKRKLKLDEKLAKEEERKKKEKSQMRLNAFFMKPTAAPTPANNSETTGVPEEEGNEEPKHVLSDYEKEFPPFFVHPHMTLAPANRFHRDPDSMKHACEKLDEALHDSATASTTPPTTTTMTDHPPAPATKPKKIFDMLPYRRRRNLQRTPCAKELIMSMQDPSSNTVDLTAASRQLEETLKKIPMKFLSYYEDVRPPYTGTFTRRIPPSDAAKLCRNPFGRLIPQVDYDYDSEAEWEDPEEGEDLDSDDGDEEVDDEDDDMDGFLDDGDEDVPSGKRKIMVDSLEPVCSGLRFESDEQDSNGVDPVFENHQLEIIGDEIQFPIDPFSTAYWEKPKIPSGINLDEANVPSSLPPNILSSPTAIPSSPSGHRLLSHFGQLNVASESSPMKQPPAGKPTPGFPEELLPDFKEVVQGSNLTKTGLVEVLKKRFPQLPKTLIRDTLNATAVRHGQREADKKWVVLETAPPSNHDAPNVDSSNDIPLIE